MVFLCGKLDIVIIEARGLPNLDFNPFNKNDKSDPYCTVETEGQNGRKRIAKTFVVDDDLNPKWNYRVKINVDYDIASLLFTVKDKDIMTSDKIGSCVLDAYAFLSGGKKYTGFLSIISSRGKPAGSLRVTVQFMGTQGNRDNSSVGFIDKIVGEKITSHKRKISIKECKFVFLHGTLDIWIDRAKNLPNLDTSILSIKKSDVSDPFVTIMIQDGCNDLWKVGVTSVIDNDLNPVWNEYFHVSLCHEVKCIKFVIRDKDIVSSEQLGQVTILGEVLEQLKLIEGVHQIAIPANNKSQGEIAFSMKYTPAQEITSSLEVPGCCFPMRQSNEITLYQDAHAIDKNSNTRRAWLDIHNAIIHAEEYIYIAGWSFNPEISLLRWDNEDKRPIGEVLIEKAKEGILVCILLWDEATSTEFNKDGFMGTHDEAASIYFRGTPVNCALASRTRKSKNFISTKAKFTYFCFTHHQKIILTDGLVNGVKCPVAFVGGLDITNGRFDTPEHNLFKNLDTDYKNDFYNHLFDCKPKTGPREPWHDVHCRVSGVAAFDIFLNFEERWKKQGHRRITELIEPNKLIRLPADLGWNVQVFRTINSDSALFSRSKGSKGIFVKKGRLFENSIHRAYIHHIRRSNKFIYIENQYFMGSSHAWFKDKKAKISNLVPLEIVAHIEEKIRNRQRFVAYIVIPMFPEGHPGNSEVKEVMFWQFRTMEMMYKRIANVLNEIGSDDHPQDYLLFFALAKREGGCKSEIPAGLQGFAANSFRNQRLMIYVHSKLAIFDDEYVIIGSANINDRSLSGDRDTEIAIGAYQPQHRYSETTGLPTGGVASFRKSLWKEHVGEEAPIHQDPSNPYYVKKMKQLAEEGLGSYLHVNSYKSLRHLIIYPLNVSKDGSVSARHDCPTIPDTNISFTGSRSTFIPTKLTS